MCVCVCTERMKCLYGSEITGEIFKKLNENSIVNCIAILWWCRWLVYTCASFSLLLLMGCKNESMCDLFIFTIRGLFYFKKHNCIVLTCQLYLFYHPQYCFNCCFIGDVRMKVCVIYFLQFGGFFCLKGSIALY